MIYNTRRTVFNERAKPYPYRCDHEYYNYIGISLYYKIFYLYYTLLSRIIRDYLVQSSSFFIMFGARLANEVKKARTESDASFFVEPQSVNNMQAWRGYILGPPDSPYEEGSFMIRITITSVRQVSSGLPHFSPEDQLPHQDLPP